MHKIREFWSRVLALFKGKRLDGEMRVEMQYHIDLLIEQNLQSGMSEREARSAALRSFGNVLSIESEEREDRTIFWIENFLNEIKLCLRQIIKHKGYSIPVILTFIVCIGLNTTMFHVLDSLFFNPRIYDGEERIVRIGDTFPGVPRSQPYPSVSVPYYLERKEQLQSVEAIGINSNGQYTLSFNADGSNASMYNVSRMSGSLFKVLNVAPILGRLFTDSEVSNEPIAILTYDCWKNQYDKDENVIGKTMFVDSSPYEIIGVLPESFQPPLDTSARIFLNKSKTQVILPVRILFYSWLATPQSRHRFTNSCFARLKPNVSIAQLHNELKLIAENNGRKYPEQYAVEKERNHQLIITKFNHDLVRNVKPQLAMLQTSLSIVLLIACANIASLILTRNSKRMSEFLIYASLGASRAMILRKIATEVTLLSILGALGSILFTIILLNIMETVGLFDMFLVPFRNELNGETFFAVMGYSVIAALISGFISIFPVLRKINRSQFLDASRRTTSVGMGEKFYQRTLIVIQFFFVTVLLLYCGLLIRSFVGISQIDSGFETNSVAIGAFIPTSLRLPDGSAEYGGESLKTLLNNSSDRIKNIPGVVSVGFSNWPIYTLTNGSWLNHLIKEEEGVLDPLNVRKCKTDTVTPGYFRTLGISLLKGRLFTEAEFQNGAPVVVIDKRIADKHYPNEDPIGKRISLPSASSGNEVLEPSYYSNRMVTIIGIVESVRKDNIYTYPEFGVVYHNMGYYPPYWFSFVIKTEINPWEVLKEVKNVIWSLDSRLSLNYASTMEDSIKRNYINDLRFSILSICVCIVAIGLSILGIYGVVSSVIASQEKEIGIQLSLGASHQYLLKKTILYWFNTGVIGILMGVVIGYFILPIVPYLNDVLYNITSQDFVTFVACTVFITFILAICAFFSTYKIMAMDPAKILRNA